MAKCAKEQYDLEEIWFMPSKIPPHKRHQKISPEADRMHMVRLAIEGISGFLASDFELLRSEVTYTAHTMRLLKEMYPEAEFYFIMGGDSLFQFEHWYHPEEIVRYTVILATGRDGVSGKELIRKRNELTKKYQGRFQLIDMKDTPVSSSMVRDMVRQGCDVEPYLPEKVADYIKKRQLYQA